MSLRSGNIGLGVAVAMMGLAVLIVGAHPSDTEMQLIFWPAFIAGIVVVVVLEGRYERRDQERSAPRHSSSGTE